MAVLAAAMVLGAAMEGRAGLLARWTFDEPEGTTAFDAVGGHHATLHDCVRVAGRVGSGALRFNGSTSRAVVLQPTGALDLADGAYTLSVWVKPYAIVNHRHRLNWILSNQGADAEPRRYALGFGSWTHQNFVLGHGASEPVSLGIEVRLNCWQHLVVTWEAGLQRTYLNGELVAERRLETPPLGTGGAPLVLGATWGMMPGTVVQGLDGELDEVRLYQHALGAREVWRLYDVPDYVPDPPAGVGLAEVDSARRSGKLEE